MMKDRRFDLSIRGITPLVMNSNHALIEGEDKGRDPAAYEREHFREKCYQTTDGAIYIPARAIKKAMILGCKFTPKKPKGVGFKSFGPLVDAALLIDGDADLGRTIQDVQPFTAVVSLDPSKGPKSPRGPRTRPLLPVPWATSTSFVVMDDLLTLEILADIAELAGKRCGLLEARAIDYGRCFMEVTEHV